MEPIILLARQPIFNTKNEIYAFELLYRGQALENHQEHADLVATSELIASVCANALEQNVNLGLPMFINVDREFIESELFFPGDPTQVIPEILETVPATTSIFNSLKKLQKQGFKFALDDYIFEPERHDLLAYSSIIKVDILGVDMSVLEQRIHELRKPNRLLLAEKVETKAVFDRCLELGFDLFQGYYLEKPTFVSGSKINSNQQLVIRLISELSRHDITAEEIADLLACDPRLAYKILLLVNSPFYQFVREIKNIKEAVIMLGLNVVKQWAIIFAMMSESTQPQELFRILLARAKALELYAISESLSEPSEYFLLGLLSGIDAVLELEMEVLVAKLKLPTELIVALVKRDNNLGEVLRNSIGIERFDIVTLESLSNQNICTFNRCYRESLAWADDLLTRF